MKTNRNKTYLKDGEEPGDFELKINGQEIHEVISASYRAHFNERSVLTLEIYTDIESEAESR